MRIARWAISGLGDQTPACVVGAIDPATGDTIANCPPNPTDQAAVNLAIAQTLAQVQQQQQILLAQQAGAAAQPPPAAPFQISGTMIGFGVALLGVLILLPAFTGGRR